MKKAAFLALALLGLTAMAHADVAVAPQAAAISNTVATTTPPVDAAPKWCNGNWMVVADYGVPGTDGGTAAGEVRAQSAAYKAAKDAGDVEKEVSNALWTSVQVWALNNAGNRALASITEPLSSDATKAKAQDALGILTRAANILANAKDLGVGASNQTAAFAHENAERAQAAKKVANNTLYAQRVLGQKPWPKTAK